MTDLRTASPSEWPELLHTKDIADILGCSQRTAQRKLGKGKFGPVIPLDGAFVIRRPVFLAALKALEVSPRRRTLGARPNPGGVR